MNINALVIEDERADRVVVRQTLANTDAGSSHVEYADSLAAGLARLARGGIDVVLLDLSLPDSEGHATLRALQDAAPLIPLLVIAGATDEAPADGVSQFILRDQPDCHRLAHVLRSVIRLHLPMGRGAAASPRVADQREGRGSVNAPSWPVRRGALPAG